MTHLPDKKHLLSRSSLNAALVVLLIHAAVVLMLGQQAPTQSQPDNTQPAVSSEQFLGTWRADFKRGPYAFVQITAISPKVVGVFCTAPGINVGTNGEVDEFWWPAKLSDAHPMIEPKLEGNRLAFTFKTEDAEHPDSFEMVLAGPSEAALRPVRTFDNQAGRFLTDEEIAKQVKPFHLKKVETPTASKN